MTLEVTLGGIEYDLPPYRFKHLRLAAPFMDAIAKTTIDGEGAVFTQVLESQRNQLGIIWAGLCDRDPPISLDDLAANATQAEMNAILPLISEIQREAGMFPPATATTEEPAPEPAGSIPS